MNILFVNYGDFTTASLNHIGVFAGGLRALGHDCIVAVPVGLDSAGAVPNAGFTPALFSTLLERPAAFADGRTADIIHAWSPREWVRQFCLDYQRAAANPARLIVHLEDNEEFLIATFTGRTVAELRAMAADKLGELVHPALPHPILSRTFPYLADAITHLTEPLGDLAPPSVRRLLLPPALDPSFLNPGPADGALLGRIGLRAGERAIVYTGSNTYANEAEIRELYSAVLLLNQRGIPTRLVRTGLIRPGFLDEMDGALKPMVVELGFVPKASLPGLMALADVLVQPGSPGPFNDYRLPSKLPEFLASGRPVILPRSNIAHWMTEGVEALFLDRGDAAEIADQCARVFGDTGLAASLGASGAAFARRRFDPVARTRDIEDLYRSLLAQPARTLWREIKPAPYGEVGCLLGILSDLAASAPGAGVSELAADLAVLTRLRDEEAARTAAVNEARVSERDRIIADLAREVERQSSHRDRLAREESRVQAELRRAWTEHATVSERVRELDTELHSRDEAILAMRSSLSWRLTAPLRYLQRRNSTRPKIP